MIAGKDLDLDSRLAAAIEHLAGVESRNTGHVNDPWQCSQTIEERARRQTPPVRGPVRRTCPGGKARVPLD